MLLMHRLGPLDETAKPQYPRTWKCLPYDITPGNPTHPATFVSFVFRYRTQGKFPPFVYIHASRKLTDIIKISPLQSSLKHRESLRRRKPYLYGLLQKPQSNATSLQAPFSLPQPYTRHRVAPPLPVRRREPAHLIKQPSSGMVPLPLLPKGQLPLKFAVLAVITGRKRTNKLQHRPRLYLLPLPPRVRPPPLRPPVRLHPPRPLTLQLRQHRRCRLHFLHLTLSLSLNLLLVLPRPRRKPRLLKHNPRHSPRNKSI